MICMTYTSLYTKYKRWATRCHSAATAHDFDNAILLLSYDAGRTESTLYDVAVRAIAIHTDRIHVFIFAVRTTWAQDKNGDAGEEIGTDYRLILAV